MFAWNIREREALMVDERVIDGVAVAVAVEDFVGTSFVSVAVGVSVARKVAVELGVRVAVPEKRMDTKHNTKFGKNAEHSKQSGNLCSKNARNEKQKELKQRHLNMQNRLLTHSDRLPQIKSW